MHVIHLGPVSSDDQPMIRGKRMTAMLQRNPLHTFMFDCDGKLVIANNAAMEACRHSAAGNASQTQRVHCRPLDIMPCCCVATAQNWFDRLSQVEYCIASMWC